VLEAVTFGAFSEIQRTAARSSAAVHRVWDGYVGLRGVQAENESSARARRPADRLQEERALATRARQLEGLLNLRKQQTLSTAAAEVIAAAPAPISARSRSTRARATAWGPTWR